MVLIVYAVTRSEVVVVVVRIVFCRHDIRLAVHPAQKQSGKTFVVSVGSQAAFLPLINRTTNKEVFGYKNETELFVCACVVLCS